MKTVDERIEQALTAEDLALLKHHGEPGYFQQAFGLFRGPTAWLMWLVYVLSAVVFFSGLYGFSRMIDAPDALTALKWGVGSVVLFQMTMMLKGFMGQRLETNRLLRELKRVELQVALLRTGGDPER